MENDVAAGESAEDGDDGSVESILEALLIDDADVAWDPLTGKPRVMPRQKPELDRPGRSA